MLLAPADPLFLITCMIYQSWSNLKPTNRKNGPFLYQQIILLQQNELFCWKAAFKLLLRLFPACPFLKRFSFFYYVSVLTS